MLSNIKVGKILQEYAKEAKLPFLLYNINELNIVKIYTDRPGILIGKAGSTVQKYENLLNELVAEENHLIRRINDKKELEWKKCNPTIPENKDCPPSLPILLKYEHTARIEFEEVNNSFVDATYNPMGEGF
jgi:hypothetical protein